MRLLDVSAMQGVVALQCEEQGPALMNILILSFFQITNLSEPIFSGSYSLQICPHSAAQWMQSIVLATVCVLGGGGGGDSS